METMSVLIWCVGLGTHGRQLQPASMSSSALHGLASHPMMLFCVFPKPL